MNLVSEARSVARELVEPLGRRWDHVQGVAAQAERLAVTVPADTREMFTAAAWLHDVGYAPAITHTRFHPLDGARHLRAQGWPVFIVNLVAHHSGARYEAAERGLSNELAAFPFQDCPEQDALCAADLTTGPDGQRITYDDRISEILNRYDRGDPVHKAWLEATLTVGAAVERAHDRLESLST